MRAAKGRVQSTKASKMASKMRYSDIPELKEFILDDVHRTGKNLGHGAFGVVEELKMGGTLCAGKRLHAELLSIYNEKEGIQRTVKRFKEECMLMSKMLHPRIVQFLGLCFFDDSIYPMLVMEKLDINLETVLETHQNIPFPLILHILQDIAEGLIHLHSQKPDPIIHRDLTARNVLVNQQSFRAKIGDLGNARLCLADHTKFTRALTQAPGTLSYMSPEALAYKPSYDGKLDVFSFGHLALFAIIQEFPKDLEAPTYYEGGTIKGRTEVERREKYIVKLNAKLTEDHVVTKLILQCLHNLPENR